MIDLDNDLANALKNLQRKLKISDMAQRDLQCMFDSTAQNNARLIHLVSDLQTQVSSLSHQLLHLTTLYERNRRQGF
jgi:plasmid stabilization system protein ParE